jgi:NADH-quinone oxidoreductase subunit J
MLERLSFAVVAVAILLPGFKVVTARNLVHTVLWLGVMLAATAALFVMLQAPFIAAIQLMLYTGGLLTLMLFGVMLTRRDEGFTTVPNPTHRHVIGGSFACAVFALLAVAIERTGTLPAEIAAPSISVQALGVLFFVGHALAFEVLALLLLAATLGAIIVARRTDAEAHPAAEVTGIPARKPLPEPGHAVSEGRV